MRYASLFLIFTFLFLTCQRENPSHTRAHIQTDSTTVQTTTFYREILGYGKIEGFRKTALYAHFPGYFFLNLKPAAQYRKGDIIFRLKGEPIEKLRQQFRTAAEVAHANLRFAREMLQRKKGLQKKHYIPVEEWQRLQRDFTRYQAEAAQADSALNYFRAMTGFRAPYDGMLQNLRVEQGEYVQEGQLLAQFQEAGNLVLVGQYFDNQNWEPGDSLLHLVLNDTISVRGRLIFLETAVNSRTGGRAFRIRIIEDSPKLKPGMFVKFRIRSAPYQAPSVPEEALVREKGRFYLIEIKDGHYHPREVTIGASRDGYRELISGPPPGTVVLTTGAFEIFHANLKETMKIED